MHFLWWRGLHCTHGVKLCQGLRPCRPQEGQLPSERKRLYKFLAFCHGQKRARRQNWQEQDIKYTHFQSIISYATHDGGEGKSSKFLIPEARKGTSNVPGEEPSRWEKQATQTFHAASHGASRRVFFFGQMQLCCKAKERKAGMEKIGQFMTALVNETHCSRDAGEEFVPTTLTSFPRQ